MSDEFHPYTGDIYRLAPALPTFRALPEPAEDGRIATLDVTFARFNTWNEIDSMWEGRFLERVAPGAFTKTMQERGSAIKALFDHGHDPQIGNKVLGPIDEMGARQDGPFLTVALMDTSYNRDLLPGFEAGVYGASYRFKVVQDDWDETPERSAHNPSGLPERTIKEVKLYEAGPVTFPADEGTTVGVRSLTDRFLTLRRIERAADIVSATSAAQQGTEAGDTDTTEPPDEGTRGASLTVEQMRLRLLHLRKK